MKKGQFGRGGHLAKGSGDAGQVAGAGWPRSDSFFEESILDGPGTAQSPTGRRHFLDHAGVDGVERAEFLDVLIDEGLETLAGLAGEDHAIGEKAMADGILRGIALAFRGCGAARKAAVAA
jgi:hypothetical protein